MKGIGGSENEGLLLQRTEQILRVFNPQNIGNAYG